MTNYDEILHLAETGELPASAEVSSSSHRVYRLNVGGTDVACKVFRPHYGDELEREWYGLTRLQEAGLDLAPVPLARSQTAIVTSWLPGVTARGPSVALHDALMRLYAVDLSPDMPLVRANPTATRAGIQSRLDQTGINRMTEDVAAWLHGDEAEALCHVHLRTFVRGDGNLHNALAAGGRVQFVDFEDCGRGDWVLDLADLVEHAQSRSVPDGEWSKFFDSFEPDEVQKQRYRHARRLYSIAWLSTFVRRGREREARAQEQRVRVLLNGDE